MTLIQTFLPVFAVIGIGFIAIRTRYLDPAAVQPMGMVVIRIALPALILLALTGSSAHGTLNKGFLLAYAAGSLTSMLICMAIARYVLGLSWTVTAVVGLAVSMANSSFMGLPIAQVLMGADLATLILAHCMIVENVLILPLALLLMALAGQGDVGQTRRKIIGDMLRNPLLIALLLGLTISFAGIQLPDVARDTLAFLARISGPIALLVIGGMLASLPAQGRVSVVGLMVVGKLAVHPLAVWGATSVIGGISGVMVVGAVLFAAMPMITIFPLLGARAGQGQLSAYGLLIATLCSFVTLPVVVYLLGLA
ncbi:AEC family transporter [Roseinatronobacter alkalisoli]|uniref:AEC family transporter n=1 Tax=Roseinatronobacter alkalisoli TaxID=3028235 RepID=A0ABT5TAB0_9RHOB|nr:AEC family transporter [Roseinatronobacter sp. HJB301]MDD7972055.1 AEC family transporter [Roseinatronobacter sp. HJB301]